jgi:hypothetical protein
MRMSAVRYSPKTYKFLAIARLNGRHFREGGNDGA